MLTRFSENPMERIFLDLRRAVRVIRTAPGFTALAVVTLTLGIGGTTAMFSVVNSVLLKPLGYREPAGLVAISASSPEIPSAALAAYYFTQWKARSQTIDGMAAVGFGYTPT